jgi:hypothetical protein
MRKNTDLTTSDWRCSGYCTFVSPIPWYRVGDARPVHDRRVLHSADPSSDQHQSVIDVFRNRGAYLGRGKYLVGGEVE